MAAQIYIPTCLMNIPWPFTSRLHGLEGVEFFALIFLHSVQVASIKSLLNGYLWVLEVEELLSLLEGWSAWSLYLPLGDAGAEVCIESFSFTRRVPTQTKSKHSNSNLIGNKESPRTQKQIANGLGDDFVNASCSYRWTIWEGKDFFICWNLMPLPLSHNSSSSPCSSSRGYMENTISTWSYPSWYTLIILSHQTWEWFPGT